MVIKVKTSVSINAYQYKHAKYFLGSNNFHTLFVEIVVEQNLLGLIILVVTSS